ncbi:MAG: peroxiredoxin [Gammaproteobacteria bacterium]|jgi:thioredoxin-dependent peroxiredoxin|nr:peroxiredoxin [Gammaproteobacteria bacterium]
MKLNIASVCSLTLLLVSLMWPFSSSAENELMPGDAAPGFELIDQYKKTHKLADYAGKWLVLYFYPKDDTPGCTTEACSFRDDIFKIHELGAEVLGVSLDSAESHAKFAEKHGLPFSLLSDAESEVAEKYGCLTSMGPLTYAKRHTFIIDPEGKLAKIYRKVKPKKHVAEVIADLQLLQSDSQ